MRRIKRFFALYTLDFWLFIVVVFILTAVMYYANNNSSVRDGRTISLAEENGEKLSRLLLFIKEPADLQASVLQDLLDNGVYAEYDAQLYTGNLVSRVRSTFSDVPGIVPCFFYKSFADAKAAPQFYDGSGNALGVAVFDYQTLEDVYSKALSVKRSFWTQLDGEFTALIEPLFQNGELYAVTGVCVDMSAYLSLSQPSACFGLFNGGELVLGKAPGGAGYTVKRFTHNGASWTSAYVQLADDYVYVESYPSSVQISNVFILVLAFTVIFFVFLIQVNSKYNVSPFSWLSTKASERFAAGLSPVRLNNYQANIIMLAAFCAGFVMYTVYQFVSGQPFGVLAVHLAIIVILLISLYFYIKKNLSERSKYIMICVSMLPPVVLNLAFGGFSTGHLPEFYAWIIIAIVFGIYLTNRRAPQIFFKLFACVLLISVICEISFTPGANSVDIIKFVSNIFYVGFVIFASLEFYMTRSIENYSVLEDVYEELKNTQTQLVQREQMVTLGQLIAGVAHEINTPIGAVKASAEILQSFDIGKLLKDMHRHSDSDLDTLVVILDMCSSSVKNMRSTIELRRGKAQVRKYLESIDVQDADKISAILSSMEICDIEKIADNMDMFRQKNILEILRSARVVFTHINSTQSIQFASDRVAKIIFSLKSFSHMNASGEEREFDVVQNIDNILVLYQNQLKRGIEIIKLYDNDIPPIYGNVEEISQVWTNIAQNAIHAMSYVGKLTIAIKNLNNEKVQISFTDTGAGIAPENVEKIFAPFFTTKPLGEGSGLGLDICKKVIDKHNGEIKVSSKLGEGTTFTITLPVNDHSQEAGGL